MFDFTNVEFAYPFVLYGLISLPLFALWYWKRNKNPHLILLIHLSNYSAV